ncbi:hypothetical protein CXG81DRAFT_6607, partial [Caulochytrium protostelioides]
LDPTFLAAVNLASQEFIKGFIAGQLILGALFFGLIKFFLLRSGAETRRAVHKAQRMRNAAAAAPPDPTAPWGALTFDAAGHVVPKPGHASRGGPPLESCEWLNVLLAAVVRRYREDRAFMANLVRTLDTALNGPRAAAAASSPSTAVGRRPSYLGPILITHFHLGNAFPRFGAARVRYAEPNGALRVEMGFSYHDQIALGIDTQILLNWPHAMTASLPVSLGVRVVHLSGVIAVQMVTPPADAEDGEAPYLAVSVLDNDHLHVDFAFRSLLGHRTKVKDLAKLGEMLASKLRSIFREAIVEPRFHRIPLP